MIKIHSVNAFHMIKKVFIATTISSLATGMICCGLWMIISGVNWFAIPIMIILFCVNAIISGGVSSAFYKLLRGKSLLLSIYLGNLTPLCAFLTFQAATSDASMKGWYVIFIIGWMALSMIPSLISTLLLEKLNKQISN